MKNLVLAFIFISLGGCANEVDKCVADWEKANPGPDDQTGYCSSSDRDFITGECSRNENRTKAQARVSIRMNCLRASKGE